MVTIAKDKDVVTLINVFTVAPEDQQRLVDVLVDATQTVMRKQPGFISANIHRSLELAPIGRQLFALDNAQSHWTAPLPLLDTYATRLLARPLRRYDGHQLRAVAQSRGV
jgi:hypothetical protein